ncbi:MAG: hypothetical protein JEZ06_11595 [Anaerolineaceae bacterium]|nr:hypothetical protein [Anaerolineaceae bacterium]
MKKLEYMNLQFKTTPAIGAWSQISEMDLSNLQKFQNDGWEVYNVVNIRGSFGFTAHILFMLRRAVNP